MTTTLADMERHHSDCGYCAGRGYVMALDMAYGAVTVGCPYTRCPTCRLLVFPHCSDCAKSRPSEDQHETIARDA